MIVFLDFEASSLAKRGYPIEVGWAAEDGSGEGHLIRPAPDWVDWSAEAEAIHGITRHTLLRDGTPHDVVARRMVEALTGHDLYASAPSWDGKWLSALLRAAGLPRHALRLRDTEEAHRAVLLAAGLPPEQAEALLPDEPPAHRALEDARRELRRWRGLREKVGGKNSPEPPSSF
ncbi:transcriptional regulator [Roseomonas haemaphysalidis]|uniref:Transcriptional regulator n=1 Tax=Roseomonas haemaphysalidis TaxID=2768162 RepID=A0ABS3KMQ5_9PROT|nr:transcriptional regulator [Roseomonas haemaphysalidis]MBO1078748.1 transcriptional regulator [Roseomonas haemaphysalidis]